MYGLDIRDPTRDRRLVEFCWRLPDEVYWANGRQRGLIRAGMAGDLPAEIRDDMRKGLQSSDILVRFRVQSAEINAALDHIAGSAIASDFLNSGALRKIFDGIVAGGNSLRDVAEAHLLARGLSVGYFLASQIR
jgi:asparagine synthase (glutamine-hydrolysing)